MEYIILLRGINISEKNKISMKELKHSLEKNNYKNVRTYLNSGNVILESEIIDETNIMNNISEIIKNEFNLVIPIFITTPFKLRAVLDNTPLWWGNDNKEIYDNLIFIIPPTTASEIYEAIGSPSSDIEMVAEFNNFIFWSFDLKKYQKANWWIKTASTGIKDKITIRTANTVRGILKLSNE